MAPNLVGESILQVIDSKLQNPRELKFAAGNVTVQHSGSK